MNQPELNSYFAFWKHAFALNEDVQTLQGIHLSSKGPYLERDSSLIYVFKTPHCTIVVANEDSIKKISTGLSPAETSLDHVRLNELLGPTEMHFDDIDHHLPPKKLKLTENWNQCDVNLRRLTHADENLIAALYENCTEDDKDTTEPNMDKDTVWGLFVDGHLVALSSYYLVPLTPTADLTVVTAIPHRGKGYAIKALKPLIHEALRNCLCPRYRAKQDNLATLKTARRLGFIPHSSIQVFSTKE